MKFKLLLLAVGLVFFGVKAQIAPQFTQSRYYYQYVNPALTGANNNLTAYVAHRSQYVGLSPKAIGSQAFGFGMPFLSNNVGVGLSLVNDYIGLQRFTDVAFNGAYHQSIGNYHKLSYGLSLGFSQFGLQGDLLRAPDGTYISNASGTLVEHNDNLLPENQLNDIAFSSNIGVNYAFKALNLGVALNSYLAPAVSISKNKETLFRNQRIINSYIKYVIDLNSSMRLEPFFLYKTDFNKHQMEMQLFYYIKNIILGASYRGYNGRANDAISGIFGFRIKEKFSFGYAYDYNLSFLNNANSGSHELRLNYEMPITYNKRNKGNVIHNSRFL